ncbi:MAG: cyclic nucleotide-binding domain-containing protein [Flavobacteriaceae bacterium]|nr:MAG: cyclic nucleotide-binding domain-containing protein [Flavobacteriaceae bacterium]
MDSKNYVCFDAQTEDVKKAFSFLSDEDIEVLSKYLEMREWESDAVVMSEGGSDDYVGFLIEGKLAVKKKTGYWDKHIIIAILEKGTMVGEGAFIDSKPRSSTVIAMEPCRILTISVEKMDELVLDNPPLAIKLMKRLLYIVSIRLRKAGERISELL